VTIVAGFKCYEGMVLCADTQETVNNLSKRNIPKLIFHPVDEWGKTKALNSDELAVAFCGAADNGPFVDKLVENAWEDAQIGTNLDEVCTIIQTSIERTYKKYGQIFQIGFCPSADLIYGVKLLGASKLFSATGPIVVEQQKHYSGGAGYYMADFLAARMYDKHISLRQCVILAAYTLFQAKEHVDGCGGESHIAVIRNNGVSGRVNSVNIESLNRMLSKSDSTLGHLLLGSADLEQTDYGVGSFDQSIEFAKETLMRIREAERPDYRKIWMLGESTLVTHGEGHKEVDEFGLPMPSNSRKKEGQQ
jgi:hypothetical protein